jgi:hypothetical protein
VGAGSQGKFFCEAMIVFQIQWPPLQTQWHKKFYKRKKLLVIMEIVLVLSSKGKKIQIEPALDDALNLEEIVVAMIFSCGYSTTTNGNPPSLGVSSKNISKKRLYFFPFFLI